MFININELINQTFFTISHIFLLDLFLLFLFGFKTRWFQLHALINFYICYLVYDDLLFILNDPLTSINQYGSRKPGYYAISLHIYHIIAFKKLTKMDYIHHILSVFIGGIPSHIFYDSKLLNFGYFFGCGLPGGITYILLILVKNNKINKLTEKKITSYLNQYIRSPGILAFAFYEYIRYRSNINDNINKYISINIILSCIWNSCYFNYDSIYNYAKYLKH